MVIALGVTTGPPSRAEDAIAHCQGVRVKTLADVNVALASDRIVQGFTGQKGAVAKGTVGHLIKKDGVADLDGVTPMFMVRFDGMRPVREVLVGMPDLSPAGDNQLAAWMKCWQW